MTRIFLAALSLAVLSFSWPTIAEAETGTNAIRLGKCARVVRDASGDVVENRCLSCQLVSVQRTRPGAGKPTSQTITVPKTSRQPLPFLGPGRTRITAERTCPGTAPEPIRADAVSAAGQKCVRFLMSRDGRASLINPCKACRAVKVEFVDIAGNRTHRAFSIAPRSPLKFPAKGLVKARILTDTPCG